MSSMMSQGLDTEIFSLTPDTSPSALASTLARLLIPGSIRDRRLDAHCISLQDRYSLFCSTCPAPQWHKGLRITAEIRCQTEVYLPLAEIQSAFRRLLRLSCRYKPFLPAVPVFSELSWVDALERLRLPEVSSNPARIITAVASDQSLRAEFLAALFIPLRYGGAFDRYPRQKQFLRAWLSERNRRSPGIAVLDAACGSGAGVYELAKMMIAAGFQPGSWSVHGSTVEPLELAAAAHGWLPHDSKHAESLKGVIDGLRQQGAGSIEFFGEDVCSPADNSRRYDVVICNGLLGGPLLHEAAALEAAVNGLAQRVVKGGMLLAADRFHAGWRKVIPLSEIRRLLVKYGISPFDLADGVGGIRT